MGTEGWQNTVQKHVFTTGQLPLHFQRCSRGNASFLSHSFGDRKQDIGGLRLSPRPPLKQLVVLKKEKKMHQSSSWSALCFTVKKDKLREGYFLIWLLMFIKVKMMRASLSKMLTAKTHSDHDEQHDSSTQLDLIPIWNFFLMLDFPF